MPEAEVTAALVGFAQLLRDGGLHPSPAEVSRFQAAVGVLRHGGIGDLYWAGRACLGVPASSAGVYDAAFTQYFLGIQSLAPEKAGVEEDPRPPGPPWQPDVSMAGSTLDLAHEGADHRDEGTEDEAEGSTASALELLRVTPFAACNSEEQEIVTALTRRLRTPPPERPGRRKAPGIRKEEVDLRATARLAMKTQAALVMPAWRQRQRRPRRVVLLIDVSRSMTPYPRLFLHFGYALVAARAGAEVVCFGTRLTRITGLLRSRQPARSLEQAAMSVLDWNGGTRITDAVRGLRAMPGVRGALRGATVIICSDGLERGDPADLGHQMYLLSRTCHEITWVNPLAGDERYQPIAGGMRMALPWVNRLMPGHTLAALEDVAATLSNQSPPRLGTGLASVHASGARSTRSSRGARLGMAAVCCDGVNLHLHPWEHQGRDPDEGAGGTCLAEEFLPDRVDQRPVSDIGEVNRYLQHVHEGHVRSSEDFAYVLKDLTALLCRIVSADDAILFVEGPAA